MKQLSEDHKRKISEAMKGKKKSIDHKLAMRVPKKGFYRRKPLTEERQQKLSESLSSFYESLSPEQLKTFRKKLIYPLQEVPELNEMDLLRITGQVLEALN